MIQTAFLKRSAVHALALGALSAGATSPAPAYQNQPTSAAVTPPAPPLAAKDPGWDYMTFNGPYKANSPGNVLVGHDFIYTRGDSTTTGDYAHYKRNDDKKTGVLDAEGNLVYDDPHHHATCNKAHVDTRIKLAVFTENVVLVLKPEKHPASAATPPTPQSGSTQLPGAPNKQNDVTALPKGQPPASGATADTEPSPASDNSADRAGQKQYGATVTCDRMEDEYRKKYMKLYGHVIFKQQRKGPDGKTQERILTAEHAEYNSKSEVLLLFGPVDGHDFEGNEFHSPNKLTVNTKEGEETMEGTEATFKFTPEEDTGDDDQATARDAKPADAKDAKGADTPGKAKKGQR